MSTCSRSVKSFLAHLGIQVHRYTDDDEAYWQAVVEAGGVPLAPGTHPTFHPAYMRLMYLSPRIGLWSVSREYTRLKRTMEALTTDRLLAGSPRRVLDLGGGHGAVGLWLAHSYPDCQVVVVDRSQESLEFGQYLANRARASNITFRQASYADWLQAGETDFDLVLCNQAIVLDEIADPNSHLYAADYTQPFEVDPSPLEAVRCIAHSLAPDGEALVNFYFPGTWSQVHFFEAVRQAGLAVDWRCSECHSRFDEKDQTFLVTDFLLVLGKGIPHLNPTSLEDAYSFLALARFDGAPLHLGSVGETVELLTADAETLFDYRVRWGPGPGGNEERLMMRMIHGLCYYCDTSTIGARRSLLTSSAAVIELCGSAANHIAAWRTKPDVRITCRQMNPRLRQLLDYYGVWPEHPEEAAA